MQLWNRAGERRMKRMKQRRLELRVSRIWMPIGSIFDSWISFYAF